MSGVREIRDAEYARNALAHHARRGVGTEHHFDTAHQRAHGAHVDEGQRSAQIAHEPAEKPRPVLTLERQFLVMDDD